MVRFDEERLVVDSSRFSHPLVRGSDGLGEVSSITPESARGLLLALLRWYLPQWHAAAKVSAQQAQLVGEVNTLQGLCRQYEMNWRHVLSTDPLIPDELRLILLQAGESRQVECQTQLAEARKALVIASVPQETAKLLAAAGDQIFIHLERGLTASSLTAEQSTIEDLVGPLERSEQA